MYGRPECCRSWLAVKVFIEHDLGRAVEVRMFHQELSSVTALVAYRNRTVRARLEQQSRVTNTATSDDDGLGGSEDNVASKT